MIPAMPDDDFQFRESLPAYPPDVREPAEPPSWDSICLKWAFAVVVSAGAGCLIALMVSGTARFVVEMWREVK